MSSNSINTVNKNELNRHRRTGAQGSIIEMHHSLRSLNLGWFTILSIILLPIIFDVILFYNIDVIVSLWEEIFRFFGNKIGVQQIFYSEEIYTPFRSQNLEMPFPYMTAELPSFFAVWLNLILCIVFYILSGLLPQRIMPITYFIRALVI